MLDRVFTFVKLIISFILLAYFQSLYVCYLVLQIFFGNMIRARCCASMGFDELLIVVALLRQA